MELRRLPELFCGFQRQRGRGPTLYPVACSPQAWASATPFTLLEASLGLEFDPGNSEIRSAQPTTCRRSSTTCCCATCKLGKPASICRFGASRRGGARYRPDARQDAGFRRAFGLRSDPGASHALADSSEGTSAVACGWCVSARSCGRSSCVATFLDARGRSPIVLSAAGFRRRIPGCVRSRRSPDLQARVRPRPERAAFSPPQTKDGWPSAGPAQTSRPGTARGHVSSTAATAGAFSAGRSAAPPTKTWAASSTSSSIGPVTRAPPSSISAAFLASAAERSRSTGMRLRFTGPRPHHARFDARSGEGRAGIPGRQAHRRAGRVAGNSIDRASPRRMPEK